MSREAELHARAHEPSYGTLFLSRGGVTVIKSIGAVDAAAAVLDAARQLDSLRATRWMSPVRLTVRTATGGPAFDATWTAAADVGTLDLVRRGYLARSTVRIDGNLTGPVRSLIERIADLVLSDTDRLEER